jgi:nucleoside-diphosphate-sugar epimerase
VRDARIVHQLRSAGYRVDILRVLMPDLPRGDRSEDVEAALAARDASITARSRALLDAAAALTAVIALGGSPPPETGAGEDGPPGSHALE